MFVPAALIAAAWPLGIIPVDPLPGLFLPFWYGFLIGVAVCWAMQRVIPRRVVLCLRRNARRGGDLALRHRALTCVVTALLLMEAARRGKLSVWLNHPALLFVGMISYSLYLIHNPITGAFYRAAYKITGRSPAAEALWLLPMIGVNLVFAFGFWWLSERHEPRLLPSRSPGEAGASANRGSRPA